MRIKQYNNMEKEIFYTKLSAIKIFKQYPQLMPFIGKYYDDNNKKLLLIGESHYLPENSTINKTIGWYDKNIKDLTDEEIMWSNTKEIIRFHKNQNNYKEHGINFHKFYRHIEEAIIESSNLKDTENMFKYTAFYNFFLRPGFSGKSIEEENKDKIIANKTLLKIIEIIKPDIIIFLSVKALNNFSNYDKVNSVIEGCPHPSDNYGWWLSRKTQKYNNMTGKKYFIYLLKKNKVFNKK